MRNINEILDKKYVDNGAYKVPEGYFDTLGQRIMDRLPAEEKAVATKVEMKPRHGWRYAAAASVAALVVGIGAWMYTDTMQQAEEVMAQTDEMEQVTFSDEYIQDAMEYAMLDDDDIYEYIAGM